MGGSQQECVGSTNAQFVRRGQWAICEIGNVNTVEHIKFRIDFHVFCFQY